MLIKEFGTENKPIILLIHGGGVSWWSWKPHIELLKADYQIKTVIIDGHGEDYLNDFISIQDTSDKIIYYIESSVTVPVHCICGLSIGAQIAVDLLVKRPDISNNWIIESALVKPIKGLGILESSIGYVYPLIKKRWYAKLQSKVLCIDDTSFEQYFEDSKKMSLSTLKAVTVSNGKYHLEKSKIETNGNVQIIVGTKEPKIMLESASMLASSILGSKLLIKEGYKHGEASLKYINEYVTLIKSFNMASTRSES